MALSRAEIELLIKARNEAQGAFDQLNKQVKTVTGETDKASQGMTGLEGKTKSAGVAAGAAGVAFGLLAERVGRGLVNAFGETIAAANRLDSGLVGLGATAKAFGTDAAAAQTAAKTLAADGLMSVGEAAAGLKNLLAGGFNLPEAIELMNRFKDSAAFGRQGSLEFGQAIVGATEGIKNGNSALVDNAGLTKNLSNILVEAGFSAQDLSKVQSDLNVRQALYNGILKETNPQLGQTALYLDTAAGKQTQFNSQIEIAQQKIGKALQPALGSMLSTLTPLVQVVGDNAEVFVRLATVVAATVGPLAAMRAGAALGIPNIITLGTSMASTLSVFKGVRSFADARAAIQLIGEASGITTGALGKMGTAAAIAGTFFAGWQIGRIIGDLTGATKAIENWASATGRAATAAEITGAKQDVLKRAWDTGAAANITYTQAIEHNIRIGAIRQAQFDKSTAAQLKAIDAELALGRITVETANARKAAVADEEQANTVRANRAKVSDILAKNEKAYRDEIKATGMTVGEITNLLKTNESGFDAWAKTIKLSDETIKRLKDSLKEQTEGHKKAAEETKKQEEATKKLNEELESMAGIITQKGLNEQLAKMEQMFSLAARQGTPALKTAVQNLWPELVKLREQAVASGLAVSNLDGVMTQAAEGAGLLLTSVRPMNQFIPLVEGISEANRVNTDEVRKAIKAQDDLTAAYKHFGIQAPQDLRVTADASRRNYEVLLASGTATTTQLKAAYRQMIDDQRAATQEVPTFWEKNVFPGVSRVIQTLQTAVQGSFAQMLLGAKGFGEGFKDIWESLKASTMQVLNEILSAFLNSFLKGMLGALAGQKNAFASAFAGLFGGGGAAGGPGGFNLQNLLGIGSAFGGGAPVGAGGIGAVAGGAPWAVTPFAGTGGVATGSGGGLLGGIGMAGLAGGALAGGAGIGLGFLGKELFGGAGLAAGGFGAGTGFATGAAIGSVVPGLGTIIGGVVGGVAGLFSGLLGKSQGEKTNDVRDQFIGQFGGQGTGEGSGFMTLAQELTKLGAEFGGGEGGGSLFRNLIKADDLKELETAIVAIQTAMQAAKDKTNESAAAQDNLTGETQEAIDAEQELADTKAANSAADLAAKADELQALEANYLQHMKVLEQLKLQGTQGPEEMAKVETAIKEVEQALAANRQEAERVKEGIRTLGRTTEDVSRAMGRNLDGVEGGFTDILRAGQNAAGGIRNAFSDMSFVIPVDYEIGNVPDLPDSLQPGGAGGGIGPDIPMAAHGVMADRASLVVFGEGGEAEVGGPRSFFRDVFEELSKEGVGLGSGEPSPTFIFNITAMSGQDVANTIQKVVMPEIVQNLKRNYGMVRTNVKEILGVR